MTGPDLGLSEAEFKSIVHQLTSSLDYLDWIWRRAEGKPVERSNAISSHTLHNHDDS